MLSCCAVHSYYLMFETGSIGSKVLEGYRLFMNFKLLLVKYYLVQFDMPELEFMVILIVI